MGGAARHAAARHAGGARPCRLGSSRAGAVARCWASTAGCWRVVLTVLAGVAPLHAASATTRSRRSAPSSSRRCSTAYGWPSWRSRRRRSILIARRPRLGFRANVWNIGAEGQYIIGALAGGGVALAVLRQRRRLDRCPLMMLAGIARRHGLGRDPGLPRPLRRQRDPDQPDADLCRARCSSSSGRRPVEGPGGLRLPADARCSPTPTAADLIAGARGSSRRRASRSSPSPSPGS